MSACSWVLQVVVEVSLEPGIAELAFRVQALGQAEVVAAPRVRGCAEEQLAPVRAGAERRERLFDVGEHAPDVLRLALPGEVDGDRVALVLRAHPQAVGGD